MNFNYLPFVKTQIVPFVQVTVDSIHTLWYVKMFQSHLLHPLVPHILCHYDSKSTVYLLGMLTATGSVTVSWPFRFYQLLGATCDLITDGTACLFYVKLLMQT